MHPRPLASTLQKYICKDTEHFRLFGREIAIQLNNLILTASAEELRTLEDSLGKYRQDNNFFGWFNLPVQICEAGIICSITLGLLDLIVRAPTLFDEEFKESRMYKDIMDTKIYYFIGLMLVCYFLVKMKERYDHTTEYDRCKLRINNVQEQINKRKNDLMSLTPDLTSRFDPFL